MRLMVARLVILSLVVIGSSVNGQEVFRNPAMENGDESQAAFLHGLELMHSARFDEAVSSFRNAIKLRKGTCPECFEMIGSSYLQAQKFKEAAGAFREGIALKASNEAGLHNGLGVALFLMSDKKVYDEAVSEFRRAIDMSQGSIAQAYYNLGHALIKVGKAEEGKAAFKTFLEKQPNAPEASEVRGILANPRNTGEPSAPVFEVKSFDGQNLSLEAFKGKVVVLDFWASWCGPCRAEMPDVKKIWSKYNGKQFVMIGVNLDRDERAFKSYMKEQGITWPQFFDGGGWNNKIARLYGVRAIPYAVLIDQDGVVKATGLRGPRLSSKIGDLLGKLGK